MTARMDAKIFENCSCNTENTTSKNGLVTGQVVFHCTVASKQVRIHNNMAENYSRTVHVTTLRYLNFGPVPSHRF